MYKWPIEFGFSFYVLAYWLKNLLKIFLDFINFLIFKFVDVYESASSLNSLSIDEKIFLYFIPCYFLGRNFRILDHYDQPGNIEGKHGR